MRLPWRRQATKPVDPNRPHAYVSKTDAGIAALSPIGGGVGRQVADIASAGAFTRTLGCAVPGCGRSRDDVIHAPSEG